MFADRSELENWIVVELRAEREACEARGAPATPDKLAARVIGNWTRAIGGHIHELAVRLCQDAASARIGS